MAQARDIGMTDAMDLSIKNGDFDVVYSDSQHKGDIIGSAPGYFKEFPLCGVGIIKYLNSKGSDMKLKNEIKLQLHADGYQVNNVEVLRSTNGVLIIREEAVRM